jgi:ABC-2 type transport system permease protein
MNKTFTIAYRELKRLAHGPAAWFVAAVFFCACGLKLAPPPDFIAGSREWFILVPHQVANLRGLFEMMALAWTLLAPLLTMRLLSEEYRSGTIEPLLTAPVRETEVILGKFLGVLGFYATLLAGTAVFVILAAIYGDIDVGTVLASYLGLLLLGAMFLALGLLASTLTHHQLLAALIAILLALGFNSIGVVARLAPAPINEFLGRLDVLARLHHFTRGLIELRDIFFFLALTAAMLVASVKVLGARRWR